MQSSVCTLIRSVLVWQVSCINHGQQIFDLPWTVFHLKKNTKVSLTCLTEVASKYLSKTKLWYPDIQLWMRYLLLLSLWIYNCLDDKKIPQNKLIVIVDPSLSMGPN